MRHAQEKNAHDANKTNGILMANQDDLHAYNAAYCHTKAIENWENLSMKTVKVVSRNNFSLNIKAISVTIRFKQFACIM